MKFKHLVIVSLLLAIFAIGAVSASEDISDDDLAVIDEVDDSIAEIDDSNLQEADDSVDDADDSLSQSDEEVIGEKNWDDSKVECDIYTNVRLDDLEGVIIFTSYDTRAFGTLIVEVGDQNSGFIQKSFEIKQTDYKEGLYQKFIRPQDLGIKNPGVYTNWAVRLQGEQLSSAPEVVILDYSLYIFVDRDNVDEWGIGIQDYECIDVIYNGEYESRVVDFTHVYFGADDAIKFYVCLPDDAQGTLTLTLDGKSYNVPYTNGKGLVTIKTNNMKLGEHTISARYAGDSRYSIKKLDEINFDLDPGIFVPSYMAVNEDESIKISAEKLSGNVDLLIEKKSFQDNYDPVRDPSLKLVNGKVSYSLKNLNEGDYRITVNYNIGNGKYVGNQVYFLSILRNTNSIKSSISPSTITSGQYVRVHLETSTKFQVSDDVVIYIDDIEYKTKRYDGGQLDEVILDLTPGTYKINVFFYHEENGVVYFHSNTKTVTVKSNSGGGGDTPIPQPVAKDTLTLNAVKVKKSAKKLVLSATLKVKGVAKKGLTVTFKFNGKKYSAKTNTKGIAKITIKKSVLKKLKVGKTIKYQASYGKLSVTKSAKVKK